MSEKLQGAVPTVLLCVGGPVAIGAIVGLPFGARQLFSQAALLPLILLGVAAMMVPALYIGAALLGAAPPPSVVARAVARSMRLAGTLLLGLAPPSLFLVATANTRGAVTVVGLLAVAAAALAALRVVYVDLFAGKPQARRVLPLFAAWAVLALSIGGRFVWGALHGLTA